MIMEKIGNIVLSALIALLGVVILVESNGNKIDIKISNKENLNVKNIKNVTTVAESKNGKKIKTVIIELDKTVKNPKLSKNEITVTQKSVSKKSNGKELDEPAIVATETKKIEREISKIYTSDKIDENGKVKNGKYLYLELADTSDNSSEKASDSDLENLKISVSQDKNNYFISSKNFSKSVK